MRLTRLAPAAIGAAALATGSIVALAGTGSGGPATAKAACADHGWAHIVSGRRKHALAAGFGHYALSHRHGTWRLAVNGDTGTDLSGSVTSNRRLRLVHRVSWAQRHGRTLTFSAHGRDRTRHLRFRTRCASRITAKFAAGSPSAVRLGRGHAAPADAIVVRRPTQTGVDGQVLRGPSCPVERSDMVCPFNAAPAPGKVRIDAVGSKGSAPSYVKTVTTDAQGRFTTTLSPGHYELTPQQAGGRPTVVDVASGVSSDVILLVDTGIR
jgi:hypothetical protein